MLLTLAEVARELRCARRSVERRELERYVTRLSDQPRDQPSDPHRG